MPQEGSSVFSLFSLIKLHLASFPLARSYSRVAVSSVFWAQNIYFSAQTRGAPLSVQYNGGLLPDIVVLLFKEKSELLLFLTFSVLVANPKKLLYTVANPARGLLNREKITKEKVWQHTPPPTPHTACSEKINKITRRIYRRYAGGRSRVRTRIPSARRLGLWVYC